MHFFKTLLYGLLIFGNIETAVAATIKSGAVSVKIESLDSSVEPGTRIAWSDWDLVAPKINATVTDPRQFEIGFMDAVGLGIWLHRTAQDGVQVISYNGKKYLQNKIADGRNWADWKPPDQGYDRSEYSIGYHFVDGKKYVLEWKGIIPSAWPKTGRVTVMFQIHMGNDTVPSLAVTADTDRLYLNDCVRPSADAVWCGGGADYDMGIKLSENVGKPITLKMTFVSSLNNGYIKFETNGITVIERSGRTTITPGEDWLKVGTLYDWGRDWVNPTLPEGGHPILLLTEYVRIWKVN